MSKYAPLATHLRGSGQAVVPMTFDAIEHVVGAKLPPSAYKHRAWWSNNPSNSVITHAWLDAGYRTADVDMPDRKLVFRKSPPNGASPETGGGPRVQDGTGPSESAETGFFSRLFGVLKGTVTVAPDTDLTSPAGEERDAAAFEKSPMPDIGEIWRRIESHQGKDFHTTAERPFRYRVEGRVFRTGLADRNIPMSDFEKALARVPFDDPGEVDHIVQGPAYVWAVLHDRRIRGSDY